MTTQDVAPKPSRAASAVTAYRPPRHPAPIDLRLDANEGAPPAPAVLAALADSGPEGLRRYPSAAALERAIATGCGVDPARVVVTAGADDGIERALRAVLEPGRELVLPVPTFEMIARYARLAGGTVIEVPWPSGPYPVDAVLAAVTPATAAIAVVSPNSPTGAVAARSDLERLAAKAPQALLLVDLAYGELADESLDAAALALPNAVVLRSFSKSRGLAGLRVGCAIAPPEIALWLRAVGHPYAVSGPALAAAEAALRDGASLERYVARIRLERRGLAALLRDLGAEPLPSQANFVLARFADAAWAADALAGLGIAVRSFPGTPGLERSLRITCPGEEASFERLSRGLAAAIAPEAILFDMDDTLVDASASYRAATIATAATYGVPLTLEDITAAKAAGGANDDWELTWRLIRDRGRDATLREVTDLFEALYQGAPGRPGLRERETLLADLALLERLADRAKLGVVTGRPRRDAMRLLEERGLSALFGAVVTMDDAPLKPSPEPVRLCLARLGATRAWMVGDTPDDVRAARSAGVVPLGVVAPSDAPAVAGPALLAAGAARVLSAISELTEVLR
jgi:histidinol-phosphate aminotransferase